MIHQRTIEAAIDLDTVEEVTSDALLAGNMDYSHYIRHEATFRHQQKNDRYVCAKCGYGVYVKFRNQKPLWSHYSGAPQTCPWWTGDPSSVDRISANQFVGRQESPLHYRLKHLIADLIAKDLNATETRIEEAIIGENGLRRPDVQTVYNGKRIAFEIQLATTQVPIILGREEFYRNENIHLIWITWEFEQIPIENIPQSFKDVYYRHNKNIFSIDVETIKRSKESKNFTLRVQTYDSTNGKWLHKFVGLNDLTWPDSGLPYSFSIAQNWGAYFRERWIEKITPEGLGYHDQCILLRELAEKMSLPETDIFQFSDLPRVINCMLSFEKGAPIGTRESNLYAYANTFLGAQSRHQYASTFVWVARKFKRHEVLQKNTVQQKIQTAQHHPQLDKFSLEARALHLIFQDWFSLVGHSNTGRSSA